MVEGMVFILRTGCPWRDLPPCFGSWKSVYTRWRRWANVGLWAAILDLLGEGASGQLRHLDSSHIKVHQDASNPVDGQTVEKMGRTKGGLNTKVTALVDSRGRALQLTLAPGNRNDGIAAQEIALPSGKRVVADKAYDSNPVRRSIVQAGSTPCIPPMRSRVQTILYHRGFYAGRHHVENFFQRIKRLRRVGTRYDKLHITFLAFVQLAAVLDWLNFRL